jgi:VCBS repeat-containing protein
MDAATGQWTYTLDNARVATQALNAGDEVQESFIARVTDEYGAWAEQVIVVTITGSNDDLTGTGDEVVTVLEDAVLTGTIGSYVNDVDDVIEVTNFCIDSNGDGVDELHTPDTEVTLTYGGVAIGTLLINTDGSYTFTPTANYSGDVPVVTYTVREITGGEELTQTLTINITPKADAPEIDQNKTINTFEDTAVDLNLIKPITTDSIDLNGIGNGDNPELLGAITLKLTGTAAGNANVLHNSTVLEPGADGKITIVISDDRTHPKVDYHHADVPPSTVDGGVYYLTETEYQALQVTPAPERHENLQLEVEVSSYEVDDTGKPLAGVAGESATQTIDIAVLAVTDEPELALSGDTKTVKEDAVLTLTNDLTATFDDIDGSEQFWYSVTGLPEGTVVTINGQPYTAGEGGSISSAAHKITVDAATKQPSFTIKTPDDYSGSSPTVKITLHVQDRDNDSTGHTPTEQTKDVTFTLDVLPQAGDVQAGDVETDEDTAVRFLQHVEVTDKGTTHGTEVIDSVSFTVPTEGNTADSTWVVNAPTQDPTAAEDGYTIIGNGTSGTYTIVFNNDDSGSDKVLSQVEREAVLDNFTITPPAHSSKDATIELSITTTDTYAGLAPSTEIVNRDVKITVNPVAETTTADTNDAGGNDVTITPNHTYTTKGEEDQWFTLGKEAPFDLKAGWSNEDVGESTYARLTPSLVAGGDGPQASAIGSQFRWSTNGDTTEEGGAWQTATYTGTPIDVPVEYLDTLQFLAPANFSGQFSIGVQAYTVDYDDDDEHHTGEPVSALSGSATLANVIIQPVADEVTLTLHSRASGLEDTKIPLTVNLKSSDPSETFNLTIADIPAGAKIFVNHVEQTPTEGSITITNFINGTPLHVQAPPDSNEDFNLMVSAESVDELTIDGTPYRSTNAVEDSQTIRVEVRGVADEPKVEPTENAASYTEAGLDDKTESIALKDLVSVQLADGEHAENPQSETLTVRVTGLPQGFSLEGGTMLVTGLGAERVWVLTPQQFANAKITVPANYSGTQTFQVAGVSTENDGDSFTGAYKDVSFTVTPSPEATLSANGALVEDQITLLGLAIQHQNGDFDETLVGVWVKVSDAETADFTLYLGTEKLSTAGLTTTNIDGGDAYYELTAEQAGQLGAKGKANADGDLNELTLKYKVQDQHYGNTQSADSPVVSDYKDLSIDLHAVPVTDEVKLSITSIVSGGTTTDEHADDDASPDTTLLTTPGQVTVSLKIAKLEDGDADNAVDADGSEKLIRIIIEGVPDGVTVEGGQQIGGTTWLLIHEQPPTDIDHVDGIDYDVVFNVSGRNGDLDAPITITVQTQDRGFDGNSTDTDIKADSVQWHLKADFEGGLGDDPALITAWAYNGEKANEDVPFTLGSKVTAAIEIQDPAIANTFTVTLKNVPVGTGIEGAYQTVVEGEVVWTASVTTAPGDDTAAAQQKLAELLESIRITAPEHSNENNAAGAFDFDAVLTASVSNGRSNEANADLLIPVDPVTDRPNLVLTAESVAEGADRIPVTVKVTSGADGEHGNLVGGKLYVKLDDATSDNLKGGKLFLGADELTETETIDGQTYYVIKDVDLGETVSLSYQLPEGTAGDQSGTVHFSAAVKFKEAGAEEIVTTATQQAQVEIVHNGVEVSSEPVSGNEASLSDKTQAIKLDLEVTLKDNDGSEAVKTIILGNVPQGFLVYTGTDAGNATLASQASNAGGMDGTNSWIVSGADGSLPAYVAISPPAFWSGSLENLELTVESGEKTGLAGSNTETFDVAAVTVSPVANGVTLQTTLTFGAENTVLSLNLNAGMTDVRDASVSHGGSVVAADQSTETASVRITGLGQYASFYIDGVQIEAGYDASTQSYTITGLSQSDLDNLGFKQARSALVDQNTGAAGTQIKVDVWTVESGNSASPSTERTGFVTVNSSGQLSTSGADTLIWTAPTNPNAIINGLGGRDTVQLRYGESVSGDTLANHLRNIEVLDLSVAGTNTIDGLTPDYVKSIVGTGGTTLTIQGAAEDSVALSGQWVYGSNGTWTGTLTGAGTVSLVIDGVDVNTSAVTAAAPGAEGFGLFSLQDGGLGDAGLSGSTLGLSALLEEGDRSSADDDAQTPGAEVEDDALDGLLSDSDATDELSVLLGEDESAAAVPDATAYVPPVHNPLDDLDQPQTSLV